MYQSLSPISQISHFTRHDKNSAAVNESYLDFVQTRGLISLVNGNHVDNSLKKILVSVNYGLVVNNPPKKETIIDFMFDFSHVKPQVPSETGPILN